MTKYERFLTFEGALGLLVVVASGRLRWNKLERSVITHLREDFEKVRNQQGEISNRNIVQGPCPRGQCFDKPAHRALRYHPVSLCRTLQLDPSPTIIECEGEPLRVTSTYHPILGASAWRRLRSCWRFSWSSCHASGWGSEISSTEESPSPWVKSV